MLYSYMQKTQLLMSDVRDVKINPDDLVTYINIARGQLAGDSESIRNYATLGLSVSTQQYNFSSIALGSPSTGIQGVLNIRQALINSGSGLQWIRPRPFEWLTLYRLNNPAPATGTPNEWSQYGQGVNGTIFVSPVPSGTFTLTLDTICYPISLALDSDTEAIPFPWTDAVPFYAAYWAYMSLQMAEPAGAMFNLYQTFVDRARRQANPSVLPYIYEQSKDPTMINQLGVKMSEGG